MSGDLENLIFSCIERYFRGALGGTLYHERHAVVTSYDPQRYLAKVMYMPEGQESGWLPIETGHIGTDYGVAVGLTPGDGKKTGDQVIVRFQEGDLESGKIVQRVHSDEDTPPTVQSGEIVIWSRFKKSGGDSDSPQGGQGGTGQQFFLKNDGSLTITDGNGATTVHDGAGNITTTCKNYTVNVSGTHTMTIGQSRSLSIGSNDNVNIGQNKTVTIGKARTDSVAKSWMATALSGIWPWLSDDDG